MSMSLKRMGEKIRSNRRRKGIMRRIRRRRKRIMRRRRRRRKRSMRTGRAEGALGTYKSRSIIGRCLFTQGPK